MKIFVTNRKVRYDYTILDTFEAGIVLSGSEVKSIRDNKVTINGSYVRIIGREAFLVGVVIDEYKSTTSNHVPEADRKLLLKRREINKIEGQLSERGLTVVPYKIYMPEDKGVIKVELALCQGKKQHDKRQKIKHRIDQREM